MEIVMVLLLVAVILFVLDGLKILHPLFSWTPLAWAFVVIAAMAYLYETTGVFQ